MRMLWSVQQGCYIHWSENLNLTLITWAVKYPENNFLSVFVFFWLPSCLNAQHKHMTSYREKHARRAMVGMPFGRCVMLRNMMDGFQTKSKFEERAAERLRADDGWIGQLRRLATAHSAHNTSYHPKMEEKKIKSFCRKQLPTHTLRRQNYLTWTF